MDNELFGSDWFKYEDNRSRCGRILLGLTILEQKVYCDRDRLQGIAIERLSTLLYTLSCTIYTLRSTFYTLPCQVYTLNHKLYPLSTTLFS